MKLKFFVLTFLLLFARGCDFYSTSLWFFDNPTDEQNILYKYFGVGWTGLIISNVIIVGIIVYAFYYYTFKYSPTKFKSTSNNLPDFVSELYFVYSVHVDPLIWDVDPPCEAGNKCKSLMRLKCTNDY